MMRSSELRYRVDDVFRSDARRRDQALKSALEAIVRALDEQDVILTAIARKANIAQEDIAAVMRGNRENLSEVQAADIEHRSKLLLSQFGLE